MVTQSTGAAKYIDSLCRGIRPPPATIVLDITVNSLMVRFSNTGALGKCGVLLYCHRSQVHSGRGVVALIGPYLWVK